MDMFLDVQISAIYNDWRFRMRAFNTTRSGISNRSPVRIADVVFLN
jgi:hypothetical protein